MSAFKYVILREHATDARLVLLGFAPLTHADLAKAFVHRATPVSAGFCALGPTGALRTYGASLSLCLAPDPADAAFLTAFAAATAKAA